MQKYSLGIQSFSELRQNGCVYVDKTEQLYQLIQGKAYFLSHPRRFGKSLLLSTLKYLFQGRQELFEGLWIADKIDWAEMQHPVLHFSFSMADFNEIGLEQAFHLKIDKWATSQGIILKNTSFESKLAEIIKETHKKYQKRVVFLVDAYDKPVSEWIQKCNKGEGKKALLMLQRFYSAIKDLEEHLRFFMVTGVLNLPIVPELNHVEHISIYGRFSTLLGYTENEISYHFTERIQEIADYQSLTYQECFDKMRLWYNSYSWNAGEDKVYNPTSILKFLTKMNFANYWFETGTPTFLIGMMRQKFTFQLESIRVSEKRLGSFALENIDEITLLFQTGYLTIQSEDDGIYTLSYPNLEFGSARLYD